MFNPFKGLGCERCLFYHYKAFICYRWNSQWQRNQYRGTNNKQHLIGSLVPQIGPQSLKSCCWRGDLKGTFGSGWYSPFWEACNTSCKRLLKSPWSQLQSCGNSCRIMRMDKLYSCTKWILGSGNILQIGYWYWDAIILIINEKGFQLLTFAMGNWTSHGLM